MIISIWLISKYFLIFSRDLLASAKAALTAQIPTQAPPSNPMFAQGIKPAPLSSNPGPFAQPASLFGNNPSIGPTNTAAVGTPGIFGSTMSPFGSTNMQSTSLQTGGKRGKH